MEKVRYLDLNIDAVTSSLSHARIKTRIEMEGAFLRFFIDKAGKGIQGQTHKGPLRPLLSGALHHRVSSVPLRTEHNTEMSAERIMDAISDPKAVAMDRYPKILLVSQ